MLTLLILLPTTLASTTDTSCLPLGTWADRAREDLLVGDFDKVREDLARAEATLDCRVASPSDLARFRLYEGALLALTGDPAVATRSFAAARRIDETTWDPALGTSLHTAWQSAEPGPTVSVTVDTNQERTLLDGVRIDRWPADVPSGKVAVQALGWDQGTISMDARSATTIDDQTSWWIAVSAPTWDSAMCAETAVDDTYTLWVSN